jgi:hypothetical protein
MKSGQQILLTLALAGCVGCAAVRSPRTPAVPRTPLDILARQEPGTKWDAKSQVEGDLDQDGEPDHALSGIRADRFVVGIVTARGKASVLDFPWKGGGEDALCSDKAKITLEPLDQGSLAGTRQTAKRQGVGLNLHDDVCDACHISWDPAKKVFSWWRL